MVVLNVTIHFEMSFPKKNYPLTIEDCQSVQLKNNWTLQGHSKAGERTSFRLDPYNILLDAGLLSTRPPKAVLLTHSHVDHTWQLPNLMGSLKFGSNINKRIPVYFPKQAYNGLTKLLEAASILSCTKETFAENEFWDRHFMEPRPINVGDIFYLENLKIEVLPATHVVNSVGYGFVTQKQKLKEEFKYLIGNSSEIIKLKNQNISIVETTEVNELAFYCDSTIHNLSNYEEWKKYSSIVIECTGFPKTHKNDDLLKKGHTHYDDLIKVLARYPNKNWYIIHNSALCSVELLNHYQTELEKFNAKILCLY